MSITFAIAILLFLVQPQSLMAQATTVTTNLEMPVNETLLDCDGEPVVLSGTVHMVVHFTTDSNGGTHFAFHSNYQDVTGTSTANPAITYRGVNSSAQTSNSSVPQTEATVVDNVLLISQGSSNNLRMKVTAHITVNANGVATAEFERVDIVCSG